jgi:hypothetical protein
VAGIEFQITEMEDFERETQLSRQQSMQIRVVKAPSPMMRHSETVVSIENRALALENEKENHFQERSMKLNRAKGTSSLQAIKTNE